jgi:hypothetical protein
VHVGGGALPAVALGLRHTHGRINRPGGAALERADFPQSSVASSG